MIVILVYSTSKYKNTQKLGIFAKEKKHNMMIKQVSFHLSVKRRGCHE